MIKIMVVEDDIDLNRFVSNVSHEIKTPLAIIQNYATLLQDDTSRATQSNGLGLARKKARFHSYHY